MRETLPVRGWMQKLAPSRGEAVSPGTVVWERWNLLIRGFFLVIALLFGARIGEGIDPSHYVFLMYGVILVTMIILLPLEKVLLCSIFILPIVPNYFDIKPIGSLPYLSLHKLTLTLLSIYWVSNRLLRRKEIFVGPVFTRWLLFYAFLQGVSLLTTVHGLSSLFAYSRYWLENYLVFFMAIDLLRDRKTIVKVFKLLVLSGTLVSLVGLAHYFSGRYPLDFVPSSSLHDSLWNYYQFNNIRLGILRIHSVFTHSIILGMFLNLVIPAAWIFLLTKSFRRNGTIYLAAMMILSSALILSLSRAAYIGAVFSFTIILCLWEGKRWRYLPLLPVVIGGILFLLGGERFFAASGAVLLSTFQVIGLETSSLLNVEGLGQLSDSTLDRWPAVMAAWEKFLSRPLLGYGVTGNDLSVIGNQGDIFYFLKVAMESGIVSLIALLSFLGILTLKLYRRARRSASSIDQSLTVICLASIVGYLINLQGATFPDLSYMFWIICGIAVNLVWTKKGDVPDGGSDETD